MESKRLKLDSELIEQLNNCPICKDIPEAEIFQCSAGHVICHSCLSKVSGGLCPQCRAPFGDIKIRNRIMEQLLDARNFPCKFSDNGCTQFCARVELTNHSRICSYNPDLIPHCEQMGSICKFKLGTCSRAEVISHFTNVHRKTFCRLSSLSTEVKWQKLLDGNILEESVFRGTGNLLSADDKETSPLFLNYIQSNKPPGYLSFVCVKVWEQEPEPAKTYRVKYSFNKRLSKPASQLLAASSNFELDEKEVVFSPIFSWTMKVYNIKEAGSIFNENPMKASIPFLKQNMRGGNNGDCFLAEIFCVG